MRRQAVGQGGGDLHPYATLCANRSAINKQPTEKDMTMTKLDMTDQVRDYASIIDAETAELSALVQRHRDHNAAMDAYLSPLRVFIRNMETEAFKASQGTVNVEAANKGYADLPTAVEVSIRELVSMLDPGAKTYDTATADDAAKEIRDAVAASKYVDIADATRVAAEVSITRWETAKRDLASLNPGTYRVGQGARQGRRGPRGPGKLVQEQGFRLAMECDTCHAVYTSGSNAGSAQDQMTNHSGTHLPEGKPYATGPYADVHRGLTEAMNRVLDADVVGQGGGWTIRREHVAAA